MVKRALALRGRGRNGLRSIFLGLTVALVVGGATISQASAEAASIVVDSKTGKVLYARNPDTHRYPASLTKMMTLYLLFEAMENGKVRTTSQMPVSAYAAAQAPSKLGLRPGQTISVQDAIFSLVTKSANDSAVVIAEYLAGGSERAFAVKMTAKARALGMNNTIFHNASGLPDPGQYTTARDMATLGRALQDDFPREFAYFSTPSFVFEGRRIGNHNRLLGRFAGVNGIKTGYTRAAGYNLVTSVNRDGRVVVAVVLGGATGRARDQRMAALLTDYFPRASNGRKIAMVVPGKADPGQDAVVASASTSTPIPRARPAAVAAADPADTGSLATTEATPIAELNTEEGDGGDDDVGTDQPVDNAMVPAGWKIQIAASPSQAGANAMLKKASATAPKLLAKMSGYTEPVAKGSMTLYRARFGGFHSMQAAQNVCSALAKQKVSCFAVQ